MHKSPLKGEVLVLPIVEEPPEGAETKTDANGWQSLLRNESLDTMKPALPDILQVTDGTHK